MRTGDGPSTRDLTSFPRHLSPFPSIPYIQPGGGAVDTGACLAYTLPGVGENWVGCVSSWLGALLTKGCRGAESPREIGLSLLIAPSRLPGQARLISEALHSATLATVSSEAHNALSNRSDCL